MTTRKATQHRTGSPATNGDAPEITQEQLLAFQRKQEEQKRLRAEQCSEEVRAVLQKYNCDLAGVPQWTSAGNNAFCVTVGVQIVPK